MAKSARSSRVKANHKKLRDTVHTPVEDARLQRLSEKLMETARANAKPIAPEAPADEMEVTADIPAAVPEAASKASTRYSSKARPRKGKITRHRKAGNAMVFASLQKRGAGKNKRKSK